MKEEGALISLILGLLAGPSTAEANPVTIDTYLKKSFKNEETYLQSVAELKAAEVKAKASDSPWLTRFALSPSTKLRTQTLELATTKTTTRELGLVGSLIQETPSATRFTFSLSEEFDPSQFDNSLTHTYGYSLKIEQPIWKNSFGSLLSLQSESDRSQFIAERHRLREKLYLFCDQQAVNFAKAYVLQEKWKIQSEMAKASAQVLKIASRGYRKKLFTKLEFLAAQDDDLANRQSELSARNAYQKQLITLSEKSGEKYTPAPQLLQSPEVFFNLKSSELKIETYPTIAKQRSLVARAQSNLELARERERSDVSLFANLGTGKSSLTTDALKEDFVELGVTLEWPIWDRSQDSRIQEAASAQRISELELAKTRRELKDESKQLESDKKTLKERLEVSEKKIKILRQQVKEGRKQLDSGRIDFNDYLNYRDRLLAEKLNHLDLQASLWGSRLKLSLLASDPPKTCKELI